MLGNFKLKNWGVGIVGEVRMFLSTTIPSNFLLLDGSSAYDLQNDYPSLYALLGDSNTLPDFRDRFVRAWGTSRDPNTTQDEALKAHTHVQDSHNHTQDAHNHIQDSHNHIQNQHRHSVYYSAIQQGTASNWANGVEASGSSSATSSYVTPTNQAATATNQAATATNQAATATNQNTGEDETRPKNIAVVFAICAK